MKSSRGRPRSSPATRASAATGALANGAIAAARRCARREQRLDGAIELFAQVWFRHWLHPTDSFFCDAFTGRLLSAGNFCGFFAQVLHAAELQLFYGAFGASEGLRDFTDTFFFSEAHLHDLPLFDGKFLHQAE